MGEGKKDHSTGAFVAAVVVVLAVSLALWAAVTFWGIVPLLEAVTGNRIPFWPTYIGTLAIVGLAGARFEKRVE